MAEKKKKIIRYFVVRREPYLAMNLNHILKRKHIESLCLILHRSQNIHQDVKQIYFIVYFYLSV